MASNGEDFATRSAALTGKRMHAVVSAFVVLVERSWPNHEVARRIAQAGRELTAVAACRALLEALDATHDEFPTVMFWWKNEQSAFLGFCPRFAEASGLPALELLGLTDAEPAVAWNRQAALYMKDDREVLLSGVPRFDILERQDRAGTTVWLRTSKVPYESAAGAGTVGGFDTISAARAHDLARARR
jgi:hypothetical protein